MKYQFNKIFLLLIKLTQNTVKPHFNSNLVFFWGGVQGGGGDSWVWLCQNLDIVPGSNPVQYQEKLIMQA